MDCMEGMGQWAADILKRYCEKEEDKSRKRILKLLWNAAAGKGKVLPKKAGLTEFLARERAKERKKEEAERRDRELLETVLTEIPGRYVGRPFPYAFSGSDPARWNRSACGRPGRAR